MKLETTLGPAKWLSGLDHTAKVTDNVPAGFESYLRILHKAHPAEIEGPGRVPCPEATWAEVASALGRTLTPETIWPDLSGTYGEPAASVPGLGTVYPPEEGRLDGAGFRALARVLSATTDGPILAAFWAGWEPVLEDKESAKAVRKGKTFSIQEIRYVLYSLEASELAESSWMQPAFGWDGGSGLTPNFLWPADESWCLATNIDLDSTILGAPSRIVSEVEALPELETFRVTPATDLTSSFPPAR